MTKKQRERLLREIREERLAEMWETWAQDDARLEAWQGLCVATGD